MKHRIIPTSLTTLAAAGFAVFALGACDVDKTEEGEMPKVDVDVDGGKMPKYDVDGPDVDVGTKKVEMEVPTIDVDMPEDGPDDNDPNDVEN